MEDFLTVNGPSISGHSEGSALSPLPLYADCKEEQDSFEAMIKIAEK